MLLCFDHTKKKEKGSYLFKTTIYNYLVTLFSQIKKKRTISIGKIFGGYFEPIWYPLR